MRSLYLLIILCLLPFVLIAFYVYPSLDDLSIPLNIREHGTSRIDLFTSLMQNWNGRYTSNFLAVFSPLTFGSLLGYRLALMLQIPALYFAMYYFLKCLLRSSDLQTSNFHMLSAALLLIYLNLLPDITETIYWLSGAKVYTWALIVQLLVAGLMISSAERQRVGKTLLIAFLIFILCGFNEIALAINLLLAIGYFLLPIIQNRFQRFNYTGSLLAVKKANIKCPYNHEIESTLSTSKASNVTLISAFLSFHRLLPSLVVVIAAIIVLTSPGNEGRLWHFPEGGQSGSSLIIATVSTAKLFGVIMQSIPLLLTGFFLFPYLKANLFHPVIRPFVFWNPAMVAAFTLLFIFGAFIVPAWAMGINPPMRIYNYLALYVIFFIFWFLFSCHAWLQGKGIQLYPAFTGAGKWIVAGLIFIAMAGDFHKEPGPEGPFTYRGNLARVTSDLVLRAETYRRALMEREEIILREKALGNKHIVVPALSDPPSSILYLDITPDPNHWMNLLQARYYGIEKIELEQE
ncbi:MAG TPA: DUF6056 family protein [Bacteroidales bacterium]|nr:DUF6056 family protein [Bacteroidales bacterium]